MAVVPPGQEVLDAVARQMDVEERRYQNGMEIISPGKRENGQFQGVRKDLRFLAEAVKGLLYFRSEKRSGGGKAGRSR